MFSIQYRREWAKYELLIYRHKVIQFQAFLLKVASKFLFKKSFNFVLFYSEWKNSTLEK